MKIYLHNNVQRRWPLTVVIVSFLWVSFNSQVRTIKNLLKIFEHKKLRREGINPQNKQFSLKRPDRITFVKQHRAQHETKTTTRR